MNTGDIVFEKIAENIYKMVKNRHGAVAIKNFTEEEIEIIAHKYKVEIR
ncbi:hypothetical protein [Paenibacillus taichungensis]